MSGPGQDSSACAPLRAGILLAIEASNPSWPGSGVAAARVDGGGAVTVLGNEPIAASTRERDDLVAAVSRLFARLGLAAREVSEVAVSVGPGGYTSVRMSVAAGALIAEAAGAGGAGCRAVPTARVAALGAVRCGAALPVAVALAHKGETAHVTVFREHPSSQGACGAGAASVVAATALSGIGAATLVTDGAVGEAWVAAARAAGMAVMSPVLSAALVADLAGQVERSGPEGLRPEYAREPEAVTLWRSRHGRGGVGGGRAE
ncbi:MAG: hypothetical protein JNK35_12110 [Phycisphaerae bacterium]|nr:hypothetical protein [Phycisphaerae bacterium]